MMGQRWWRRRPRRAGGLSRPASQAAPKGAGSGAKHWLFIALAFVVLVASLTEHLYSAASFPDYDVDTEPITPETIQANFAFETPDLKMTAETREAAAAAVPATYRVEREWVRRQLDRFEEQAGALASSGERVAQAVWKALEASNSSQSEQEVVRKALEEVARQLVQEPKFEGLGDPLVLVSWLVPAPETLPKRQFASESGPGQRVTTLEPPGVSPIQFADAAWLTKLGRNALAEVLNYGILDSEGRLAEGHASGASQITILRDRPAKGLKASQRLTLSEVPRMDDARERLRSRVLEMAKAHAEENPGQAIDWARLGNAAYELAKLNLSETMAFDGVATEAAREAARCAAAPVMKTIQRFEVIQRGGEPWTEQARSDVKMYWAKKRAEQGTAGGAPAAVVSHMIFVGLVLTALVRSVRVTSLEPYKPGFHLNLALLILCGTLVVGRVVSYFDPSGFTVPVAAGTILLAILTQVRVAVITSFAAAVLLSVQYGYNWRLLVVSLAMAMAGALSILKVRRRSDMTTASVRSAAVGIAAMAAVLLAAGSAFSEAGLRHLLLIGLNGAACLFIVPGMLSPLERLFGITTDIQLLEYSDLNNEILSRMAIEVPATYTHSLMVGQLAEVAADAIGANGLLARVCAYYHDIGKLRRPEYFSENQIGYNIHDSLSPRLSARAIASHALEGVEIARAHHLPTPIVDGILEHHGTCLVSFFHQQAAAQDRHGDVREEDFRYPGPKPQSRETAILMICDVVESGVRSIKHPNEERVREFVDKIILARGADRQFDESGLTLKELDAIKEAVTRRMLTALHTRIAYPEQPRNVIPISGGGGP